MVNIYNFEKTLKVKWIKQLSIKTDAWTITPNHYQILDVLRFGKDFPKHLLGTINNPFWESVFNAYDFFQVKLSNKLDKNVLSEPLWYNDAIKLEYIQLWDRKGLNSLCDLFTDFGEFKTRQVLNESYKLNLNFIDFHRLVKSIPREWVNDIKDKFIEPAEESPWCPIVSRLIMANSKKNPIVFFFIESECYYTHS